MGRQALEQAEHLVVVDVVALGGHVFERLQRRTASEDTQQQEQRQLVSRQQPAAPVQGRAHGALPLGEVTGAG